MVKFIISPAKQMHTQTEVLAASALPGFVDKAQEIASVIRSLSLQEAQQVWNCSDALAELNYDRFSSLDLFGEHHALTPALLSYEGVQYQHMAPEVFTDDEWDYVQNHLRILSGFYGVLKPLDGVTPYRLEMQAKLSVAGAKNLYEFWGDALFQALQKEGTSTLVNLASVEYAKAVTPYAKKAQIAVITCLFGTLNTQGKLVQRSVEAKTARGTMVRWCAENALEHVDDLQSFNLLNYAYQSKLSDDTTWVFVRQ